MSRAEIERLAKAIALANNHFHSDDWAEKVADNWEALESAPAESDEKPKE